MIKQHLHFNVPETIDVPIWRYISYEKLESLLSTSALYFSRADLLGDNHEGSVPEKTIQHRPVFYEGATKRFIEKGLAEMAEVWRKCTYVSCWHMSENESVAMWKLYLPEGGGVAIKTTISCLKESISDTEREFCLNPISYVDFEKDYASEWNAFAPFFIKRDLFKYEAEFRILTDTLADIGMVQSGQKVPEAGLLISVDIKRLLKKIVISPSASEDKAKMVKNLLSKYGLNEILQVSKVGHKPTF